MFAPSPRAEKAAQIEIKPRSRDTADALIEVAQHEKPSQNLLAMITLCPAGCYSLSETGKVEVATDGCFECGNLPRAVRADGRGRVELSARRLRRAVQVRLRGAV